jgi:hypothetical protein
MSPLTAESSPYVPKPGDYVAVLARVIDDPRGTGEEYTVELFSKTDQYRAAVRADLVIRQEDPPRPAGVPDGWARVAALPYDKYVLVETDQGYDVYSDGDPSFT